MMHNISSKQYIIGLVLLFVLMSIFIYIPLNIYPAEDAAILFQFSENLAQTGAITYNLHGVHAEGATDFLWMVLLGLMHFIGFDTYLASTILSMVALVGTAYLLFKITNTNNTNYFLSFVALLIFLPMIPAAIQGFSPLFFGFFIVLTTYFFLQNKPNQLFLSALLLCLVRPDGVVFAFPLIVLFLIFNRSTLKANMKKLLIYFIIPGLIYFIWRWNYFGEFLPLPFYVKSNFDQFLFLFNKGSLKQNMVLSVFFLPTIIFIIGAFLRDKADKKIIGLFIAIVFIPFIFYSAMMLSQNVSYRFQYSIVLGLLILSAYLLHRVSNKKIILILLITQILFILPISTKQYLSLLLIPNDQITYVAKGLNHITTDASMAITEAGRLPYYSKWKAIDTWGLNTPSFAKTLIQPDDIRTAKLDLIVVHAAGKDYSALLNLNDIPIYSKRTWSNMTSNIFKGIDMDKYTLYMVPFTHHDNSSVLPQVYYKLRSIKRKFLKGNSSYVRYDAYFVRNSFQYSKDVKDLLIKYNAISFEEFLKVNVDK